MHLSSKKGNNPEVWQKLLELLDERLQLGLMNYLERVASYHLEGGTLTLQAGNKLDLEYLSKDVIQQQLKILAQEICTIENIKVLPPNS